MSTTPVSPNRIRILTVDDHPLILEGIANVLQRQPDMELVGEASDGYEAIEAFAKLRPDVALIDLQMPGMNGIDTISAILQKWPGARCVVLTTYAGDVQATRALKAGAKGLMNRLCGVGMVRCGVTPVAGDDDTSSCKRTTHHASQSS